MTLTRTRHTVISSEEAADRLALRELFDAYAHCADRRDAVGQQSLFTQNTTFAVFMSGANSPATYTLTGRDSLAPVFADLNKYDQTTHFNGQSTVNLLGGGRASGECYTIAHHVYSEDGVRKIMIASLRYLDKYEKVDGLWLFAKRELILDWAETRVCTPAT